MYTLQRGRGFTLIELLVVIAIIGILSSVVLASLNSARRKGRDARRISDIKQIQLALEMYQDSSGTNEYPEEAGGNIVPAATLAPTYIPSVPLDPLTGAGYPYINLLSSSTTCAAASQVCSGFVLGATLEDSANPALATDVDGTVAGVINCGSGAPESPVVFCVRQ